MLTGADTDDSPPYRLTHAQAARILGVHELSVTRMVRQGRLPQFAPYAKAGLLRSDVEALSATLGHRRDRQSAAGGRKDHQRTGAPVGA